MWKYRGQRRPAFADPTGPGQESVWDYPRPPELRPCDRVVEVRLGQQELARTSEAVRVLETASPPGFYLPPHAVERALLRRAPGRSRCEWKGVASYWRLAPDANGAAVGWSYQDPTLEFEILRGYLSFYPGRVECYVDGERVRPQPGRFYGGWITADIAGPVKGAPGTEHW